MSRLKRFALSLVSGYVALAANVAFTLASVPLAFQYLSKAEFGLWALCSQVGGYLALIDFGMSGAQSRILVDYKDEAGGTNYGSTFLTGLLVGAVQGLLVLAIGAAVLWLPGPLPGVPAALGEQFRWLMLGQCALAGVNLVMRSIANLLWAHQRSDVSNMIQVIMFALNYAALWVAFAAGAGVFSLLWGLLAGTVIGVVVTIAACARLRLFPSRGRWGRPTRRRFKELFAFGKDVFLFAVGSQMVNASQTILIAPLLGLEAAGIWAVCIRPFTVATQLVWRVLDFSVTPLSEMLVRGEHERFFERFRSVTILTGAMAVVVGVVFAVCNQPFVQLWTQGKVGWSMWNDVLLAIWGVFVAVQRCHCGLAGVTKQLSKVKYVCFLEGLIFVALALVVTRELGFPGLIGSSLVATFSVSFLFGLWRSRTDFKLGWWEIVGWLKPAALTGAVLVPLAIGIRWAAAGLSPELLLLLGCTLGLLGGGLLVRFGLEESMQQRLVARAPGCLKALLLSGKSRPAG